MPEVCLLYSLLHNCSLFDAEGSNLQHCGGNRNEVEIYSIPQKKRKINTRIDRKKEDRDLVDHTRGFAKFSSLSIEYIVSHLTTFHATIFPHTT